MLKLLNKRRRKKGQSTLEYAVLIVIILAALLSIQFYIKRGVQGRFKEAVDDIGDQFSPGNTFVNQVVIVNSHTIESFKDGVTNSVFDDGFVETTTEDSTMSIINGEFEYMGF